MQAIPLRSAEYYDDDKQRNGRIKNLREYANERIK